MIEEQLVERWETVIDHNAFDDVRDPYRRYCMARILENTNAERGRELLGGGDAAQRRTLMSLNESTPTNVMGGSSSTAGAGPIDIYDPILIGLVRRTMPKLIAYDVCGVQPMKGPTGTIFALRGRYSSQNRARGELFYNEANTSFSSTAAGNTTHQSANSQWAAQTGTDVSVVPSSGSYTVAHGFNTLFAELLGKDTGNEMQEVGITVDKVTVEAKARALKATYSVELAQDLMAIHGLSAETELSNFITNEILAEINREVIRTIYLTATVGAQGKQTNGIFNLNVDADGRWSGEKVKGLLLQIGFEANDIAKETRFGKGNLIICSSNIATALDMAGALDYSPELAQKLNVDDTGNTFAGVLRNGMKVFIDPYHRTTTNSHFVTVGYRGDSPWDAGLFYCPYVPLMFAKAITPNGLQPVIGFKTRYGLVANPFATTAGNGTVSTANKNRYYRIMAVTNLL
jgi:hypothetical protein